MRTIRYAMAVVLLSGAVGHAQCNMKLAFEQADDDGASKVSVWEDSTHSALLFGGSLHVNTDGTKRSYKVDDFWGVTDAINNLCNAMTDKCAGLTSSQLSERRKLTQKAKATGWPADLTKQTRIGRDIIAFKPNGKPCAEIDGFLVSATALRNDNIKDNCEPSKYVDAMTVPALVLPGRGKQPSKPTAFENRGARVGDLAAVLSGDGKILTYAVVGDIGPAKEIGEVTVSLAGILKGKTKEPANYCEVRGKKNCGGKDYSGQGWDVRNTYVVVFPDTRDEKNPYVTADRIKKEASARLKGWEKGEVSFRACAADYK